MKFRTKNIEYSVSGILLISISIIFLSIGFILYNNLLFDFGYGLNLGYINNKINSFSIFTISIIFGMVAIWNYNAEKRKNIQNERNNLMNFMIHTFA